MPAVATKPFVLPKPQRVDGLPDEQQLTALRNYSQNLYSGLLLALTVMSEIGKIGVMETVITDPPTQAQVAELRQKLNAVVLQCQAVRI